LYIDNVVVSYTDTSNVKNKKTHSGVPLYSKINAENVLIKKFNIN